MKKSEQGSLVLSALEIRGPLINAIPQINLYKMNNIDCFWAVLISLYLHLVPHPATAYPSFLSMKWLGVLLLPPGWDVGPAHPPPSPPAFHQAFLAVSQHPFILLVGERHCERKVSFPITQHIGPARYPNQTSQPRVQFADHKETASPTVNG